VRNDLDLHAIWIGESQHLLVESPSYLLDQDAVTGESLVP
jgi:hypothetical protein